MSERVLVLGDWETTSPLIRGLEGVLQNSKTATYPHPEEWHAQAAERAQDIDSGQVLDTALRLLDEIPYEAAIEAIKSAHEGDPDSFVRMRMSRKLLLVARDAIILSTNPIPTEDYQILRSACQWLGQLSDARGENATLATQTVEQLDLLSQTASRAGEFLHSSQSTRTKIEKGLHTTSLLRTDTALALNPDVYHKWRKDFRRVANVYSLISGSGNDRDFKDFASQGLLLSSVYGEINDTIDKVLEK
jgi:hypothetical protein